MIHGLCNAGSIEEALKLFNEMLCHIMVFTSSLARDPERFIWALSIAQACLENLVYLSDVLRNSVILRRHSKPFIPTKLFFPCFNNHMPEVMINVGQRVKKGEEIKGPSGERIYDFHDKIREKYEFVVQKSGVYQFRFTNKSPYHKTIDFDIYVGHFIDFE
ncbi:hypothetical protein Q3G72_017195 [Acer saccharum]|nr:hypothetical protein Q3G72_017195 [Acer saccharum]